MSNELSLSVSLTFNKGGASVSRSEGIQVTVTVDTFVANTEEYGLEPEHTNVVYYRIGAKAGAFTSGSCNLRLSN